MGLNFLKKKFRIFHNDAIGGVITIFEQRGPFWSSFGPFFSRFFRLLSPKPRKIWQKAEFLCSHYILLVVDPEMAPFRGF